MAKKTLNVSERAFSEFGRVRGDIARARIDSGLESRITDTDALETLIISYWAFNRGLDNHGSANQARSLEQIKKELGL